MEFNKLIVLCMQKYNQEGYKYVCFDKREISVHADVSEIQIAFASQRHPPVHELVAVCNTAILREIGHDWIPSGFRKK
jgi:hypothetical protein